MTQYLYAVDRNNPRVSPLYNPITPSFLRMLQQIVTTAHQRGKWVGICGELGGESRYLPLLLGLGLDELSMTVNWAVKAVICRYCLGWAWMS